MGEIISLSAQITRCYSDNKSTPYRVHLAISSWGGALKTRFENVLASNHLSWKGVRFYEGDFVNAGKELDGIMRGREGGKLVGALAPPVIVSDPLPETSLTEDAETVLDPDSSKPEPTSEADAKIHAEEQPEPSIVSLTADS